MKNNEILERGSEYNIHSNSMNKDIKRTTPDENRQNLLLTASVVQLFLVKVIYYRGNFTIAKYINGSSHALFLALFGSFQTHFPFKSDHGLLPIHKMELAQVLRLRIGDILRKLYLKLWLS